MPMQAAFFYDYPPGDGDVYGQGRRERLEEIVSLYPHVVRGNNFDAHADSLRDVEVIFATWGMPNLSDAQLGRMPNLEAVFYAAGNVKAFAQQLIDHDILLVSAWAINAIPVAEMALAQVLLSCRGYYRAMRRFSDNHDGNQAKSFNRTGVFGETVGLIGMGMIGKRLAKHLQDFSFKVIANDPFLSEEQASDLGVERVSLEDLFRRSHIVSNHIPDIPSTKNVLTGSQFESMREGATFINTGRGAQIAEPDLIRALKDRPDLTALLDVTYPEPPPDDSELWTLPNVWISPHVGGSVGDEVVRMADCAIEEFIAWESGKSLRYQVTREVLATMG